MKKKNKRSIKIKLEIVPPEELNIRASELGMTVTEFVNYQAKKHRLVKGYEMGQNLRVQHHQRSKKSKEYDNFDWRGWKGIGN